MSKPRFYVYRLLGEGGTVLYIGKGCGRRLRLQQVRHKCAGEIIRRFRTEEAAFKFEAALVNELKPPRNKCAGGSGGRARPKPKARRFKWEIEIERVGSRRYVARELLKFDLRGRVEPSKVELLRQIANGPRC